jgi:hypothetical protein
MALALALALALAMAMAMALVHHTGTDVLKLTNPGQPQLLST